MIRIVVPILNSLKKGSSNTVKLKNKYCKASPELSNWLRNKSNLPQTCPFTCLMIQDFLWKKHLLKQK
jgi:hypothetical protein